MSEYEYLVAKNGRRMYSKVELMDAYTRLSHTLNKTEYGASCNDIYKSYKKGEFPVHYVTIMRKFESMNKLRIKCGFKETLYTKSNKIRHQRYSKQDLIGRAYFVMDSGKKLNLVNFGLNRMPAIRKHYGSWVKFLKDNDLIEPSDLKDKVFEILKSNKYEIDLKKNTVVIKRTSKPVFIDTSQNMNQLLFYLNSDRIKLNKYVFFAYLHNVIDETFDTRFEKIVFKNGREEYTKNNIEIEFKSK